MQDSKVWLGWLWLGLGLSACRTPAQIPYDLSSVVTASVATHDLKVAILPLVDARDPAEAPDARGLYRYNGLSYRGTRLEDLGPRTTARLTEVLAQHLARARIFSQVILVLRPEQAPEADLILTGKVRRARGYVQASPPTKDSGRSPDSRKVIAEVVLQDLELRPTGAGGPRISLDVGWSILEERKLGPKGIGLDPWNLLSEALGVSLRDLSGALRAADLSGDFVVADKISLQGSATSTQAIFHGIQAPAGWARVNTSTASHPTGWKGQARCSRIRFEAQQSRRFSRVLGPYVPAVQIWGCPKSLPLKFSGRSEYPARLLGHHGGHWYFSQQLGRTNWPDAEAQLAAYLQLQPPPSPYVFEVGPGAKAVKKTKRIDRSVRRRVTKQR